MLFDFGWFLTRLGCPHMVATSGAYPVEYPAGNMISWLLIAHKALVRSTAFDRTVEQKGNVERKTRYRWWLCLCCSPSVDIDSEWTSPTVNQSRCKSDHLVKAPDTQSSIQLPFAVGVSSTP
jgi:hypothetical protein